MSTPTARTLAAGRRSGPGLATAVLLPWLLARSAGAAETTTTTGPGATTATQTGSQYGFASFLFFLALAVAILWLVRR